MKAADKYSINLLGADEQRRRLGPILNMMRESGIHQAIIRDNANIYYLTGRVFRGYIYLNTDLDNPRYFVRQPNHLTDPDKALDKHIHKPEQIPAFLTDEGIVISSSIALELDIVSFSESKRLAACFGQTPEANISGIMRRARAVKTDVEIAAIRESGVKQSYVYERIPHLYRRGMTDIEFQIEIEHASRLEGCLGQFRVSGPDMELFMGNVLSGANADTPSPYDFAMGGEGMDPSIPVGANGSLIIENAPIMVDVNGNYTGYMTDMTRMYISGEASEKAIAVNQLSIDICAALASMMTPGARACDLYNRALEMATQAGMADYFMGHNAHAGFVGHGVGIEINELPVLAPRSKDILQAGNVIAVEPKFVIPGLGAIGIENTYVVRESGAPEVMTTAPTSIVTLD